MAGRGEAGNHVAEWFGHRVHPTVATGPQSLKDMQSKRCPFLSDVVGNDTPCVKPATSSGICTVSSSGPSGRKDWLVCPNRALDRPLLDDVARRIFGFDGNASVVIEPAPALQNAYFRLQITEALAAGHKVLVYMQSKLGGEISLAPTARSPELSFDTTLIELTMGQGSVANVGRYGILEVQTMDFHGSYKHAVKNLEDALRLHGNSFPSVLGQHTNWLSDRMEGPNIANVFKRTFYQMVLKFQIAGHGACAGSALAIPAAVWDSWQRHLGAPTLVPRPGGSLEMWAPGREAHPSPAWIYVFDLDEASTKTPSPIRIAKVIATDAESVVHFALKVVPDAALAAGGSADNVLATIYRRLHAWWPMLGMVPP